MVPSVVSDAAGDLAVFDGGAGGPVCPVMGQHHLRGCGVAQVSRRAEAPGRGVWVALFVACLGGEGSLRGPEGWRTLAAGEACLLDAAPGGEFDAGPGDGWQLAWVRLGDLEGIAPAAVGHHEMYEDAVPLKRAIEGLYAEVSAGGGEVTMAFHWVQLIRGYVQRFVAPLQVDERVWRVWGLVERNLREPWTLGTIASAAKMSGENFRRLCLKALGRSPMKHLTFLRMRHAAELLATTEEKVETVASMVGYDNPYAFSNTFLKWAGVRPSVHRATAGRGD